MKTYAIELEIEHAGNTHEVSLEVCGDLEKDYMMYPDGDVEITNVVIHGYDVVACEPPLTEARRVIDRSYMDEVQDLFQREYCDDEDL